MNDAWKTRASPSCTPRRPSRAVAGALMLVSVTSLLAAPLVAAQEPQPPPSAPAPPGPGTPTPTKELKVAGRVKFSGRYDFGGLQGSDAFSLAQIDTSPDRNDDDQLTADLKQSRLHFDAAFRGTRVGDVIGVIESDFRGKGGTANFNFRLRLAYVQVLGLTIGQARSTFGDPDADASVIDLDGPPTTVWLRTPQVRYTARAGSRWRFAVAAETPVLDYTVEPTFDPSVTTTFLRRPDLVTSIRCGTSRTHLQLAAVYREIRYRTTLPTGAESETRSLTAGGAAVSGRLHLAGRDRLVGQLMYGKGIAHYMTSFEGGGWDAGPDGSGNLQTTLDTGAFVAYEKYVNRFRATVLAGGAIIGNTFVEPRSDFFRGYYGSVTGFYDVLDSLWVGAEYLEGRKRDYQGRRAGARRIQFAMQFSF